HIQVSAKVDKTMSTNNIIELKFLEIQGNAGMINPIGRLPIAFLSRDMSVDYPVPSNIWKQSVDWNVGLSDLKTASSAQGHGQLVTKHPEGQKINKKLHMGMHTAIDLPQSKKEGIPPTTAEYINASPDLNGQLDVLKFDAVQILNEHGIQAKGGVEGGVEKFASGFDRLLSMADVQEIVEDNQDLYAQNIEDEIFQIIKATQDELNKDKFTSDKLQVTFEKPKVLISDKETLENIRVRDELGLLLAHEKHMLMNPNLNEDQAKKREE
ncbi:unnamed protein product, partial [marine sediment metagenome]